MPARAEMLAERDATHSLEDRDSPALAIVIEDIARVRSGPKRRGRAAALISTLGRAWERLGDYAEVRSAYAYNGWDDKGAIPAYWLWQARDVEWLDDQRGKPRRPSELRVRTPGTEVVYGPDRSNFVHADLYSHNWQPVLSALGVLGDPSRGQLVARLKELRAATQAGTYPWQEAAKETAIVYKALARSLLGTNTRSDLSPTQLRREFSNGEGLVFTDAGWRTPERVFGGDPVLGRYGVFAPAIDDTEALWEALGLRRPSVMDCVQVIRKIARRFPVEPSDTAILLDALRVVASDYNANATARERRALRELPLLTQRGWVRQRPVYVTDDKLLADGLGDGLEIWRPGGELEQFSPILEALRVRQIDAADAQVIRPDLGEEDPDCTEFFRAAIQQLHEDLVRNEPDLAHGATVPWERLGGFEVRIHPSLAVRVTVDSDTAKEYECAVAVKVDVNRAAVFVCSRRDLASVDRGGRALATLFNGDGRQLAHAWRGACDRAEEGRPANVLELARERAARKKRENEIGLEDRMAAFQQGTSQRHGSEGRGNQRSRRSETLVGTGEAENGEGSTTAMGCRVLVDPATLRLRDSRGRVTEKTDKGKTKTKPSSGGLVEPGGPTPQTSKTPPPSYTSEEKERVGLELLQMVLGSNVVDVRAKHRVGADAFDEDNRPFELKVSAGREPDVVTLTASEVMRAAIDPNFVLVVVSGVEGADAQPTVRFFLDPLKQLRPGRDEGKIYLQGVRGSRSLVYEFAQGDAVGPRNEGN